MEFRCKNNSRKFFYIRMNTIVSFYTSKNSYPLSDAYKQSVDLACQRWNCNYVLITVPLQPEGYHDMYTKLYLPSLIKDYDRCLYLDTDVVIKSDAPNPFEIYDDTSKVYVVKDMQQDLLTHEQVDHFKDVHLCGPYYQECKRVLNVDMSYFDYKNKFFNAGVLLFTPSIHNHLFDKIIDVLSLLSDKFKNNHLVEQSLVNYTFMSYLDDKLTYIPKEWNYIDPPIENKMEGYIYHFTGFNYKIYKEILPSFDLWKK